MSNNTEKDFVYSAVIIAAVTVGFCLLVLTLSGCAGPEVRRPLVECRQMCQGDHVEEYHDDDMTCKCQPSGGGQNE